MNTGNPGNTAGFRVRLLGVILAVPVRGIWEAVCAPEPSPLTRLQKTTVPTAEMCGELLTP